MNNKIFVYGTLKAGRSNERVMQMAGGKFVGEAVLHGYQMFSMGGFPGIRKITDSSTVGELYVRGELYEVKDLRPLDSLEGCRPKAEDSFYWRTDVLVEPLTNDDVLTVGRKQLIACQTYVPQGDYSDMKTVAGGVW